MRDRIWAELTQSKHSKEFLVLYSRRQRAILRYFNIGILTFSAGGIMGWKIWEDLPLISCVVIAIISLIKLIQPHLIMSDKLLSNLDTIHKFYIEYYNNLEKLWYEYEAGRLSDQESSKRFFKLKESEGKITQVISDTIRTTPEGLVKKAKTHSDQYFKQIFNTSIYEQKNN